MLHSIKACQLKTTNSVENPGISDFKEDGDSFFLQAHHTFMILIIISLITIFEQCEQRVFQTSLQFVRMLIQLNHTDHSIHANVIAIIF